jgi:urease
VKLNYVETIALLSSQLLEFMRDGCYSVAQLMDLGKQMLGRRHVLPDVIDMVKEVQIEGTFPDGTYLVTVHDPICTDNGNIEMALYGSFYPIPDESLFQLPPPRTREDAPGAIIGMGGPIILNTDRKRISLTVTNHGDRAIQVSYTKTLSKKN